MESIQDIQGVAGLLKAHEAKREARDAVIDEKFKTIDGQLSDLKVSVDKVGDRVDKIGDRVDKLGDRMWWMMGILTVGLLSAIVAIIGGVITILQ